MTQVAYSYSRVSSMGQLSGTGIARQIEKAEEYCRANGLLLSDEIFSDKAKSAFKNKHLTEGARLAAFIQAAKKGQIPKGSVLIVEALDRLSRDEIEGAVELLQSILKLEIDIVTLSDGKRYSCKSKTKVMDWITSILYFDAANDYSKKLSFRVGRAWTGKQESGSKLKPSYPSWLKYQKTKDSFSVIEEKADVVRRLFKEYLAGSGYGKIARGLNDDGIRTMTGKTWSNVNVKFLLSSPAVIGEYRPGKRGKDGEKIPTGIVHKNHYPAIISEADFYKANARLKSNPPKEGRPQKEGLNLWDGLFKCGYCGSSMGVLSGKNLVCWKSVSSNECARHAWEYREFELPLLLELKEATDERREEVNLPIKDEITSLNGKVEDLTVRIGRLNVMAEKLDDPSDTLQRINVLSRERSEVQAQIKEKAALLNELAGVGSTSLDLDQIIHGSDTGERKAIQRLMRNLVERIEVFPAGEAEINEAFLADRKRMLEEGKSIHVINKVLIRKYGVGKSRFMVVHTKNPVVRQGTKVTSFRVKVEAMAPTLDQIKALDALAAKNP